MANSNGTLTDLANLAGQLRKQEAEAQQKVAEICKQIDAVELTMRLYRHDGTQAMPDIHDALVAELRKAKANKAKKKTQMDALILIANKSDGIIKVTHAQRLMVETGFISNPKNAPSTIYTLIDRSGRFEKVKPGEYRLLSEQGIQERQGYTPSEWEEKKAFDKSMTREQTKFL